MPSRFFVPLSFDEHPIPILQALWTKSQDQDRENELPHRKSALESCRYKRMYPKYESRPIPLFRVFRLIPCFHKIRRKFAQRLEHFISSDFLRIEHHRITEAGNTNFVSVKLKTRWQCNRLFVSVLCDMCDVHSRKIHYCPLTPLYHVFHGKPRN